MQLQQPANGTAPYKGLTLCVQRQANIRKQKNPTRCTVPTTLSESICCRTHTCPIPLAAPTHGEYLHQQKPINSDALWVSEHHHLLSCFYTQRTQVWARNSPPRSLLPRADVLGRSCAAGEHLGQDTATCWDEVEKLWDSHFSHWCPLDRFLELVRIPVGISPRSSQTSSLSEHALVLQSTWGKEPTADGAEGTFSLASVANTAANPENS